MIHPQIVVVRLSEVSFRISVDYFNDPCRWIDCGWIPIPDRAIWPAFCAWVGKIIGEDDLVFNDGIRRRRVTNGIGTIVDDKVVHPKIRICGSPYSDADGGQRFSEAYRIG